jgi:hypothetical protein
VSWRSIIGSDRYTGASGLRSLSLSQAWLTDGNGQVAQGLVPVAGGTSDRGGF